MPLLTVRNVSKKGPGEFHLKDISFTQEHQERIGIAGETGAGKSTLLKLVAGLLEPDEGVLLFGNEKILGPADQLVPGHPRIAYLWQHFELQKSLRVEQVLAYSNKLSSRTALNLYKVCQIDHLLDRRTDELSGGEKQRVAICRLLISTPGLLLLDEPYAHLDMAHKQTLKDVIRDIGGKLKITCILVSHDPMDTLSWAEKMMVMRDGRIVQTGTPEEVYNRPVDLYTGALFGKYNIISRAHGKAFSRLAPVRKMLNAGHKNIFVRPEQFRLVRKGDASLKGKVLEVRFYGTFREVDVLVSKQLLTVRTSLPDIAKGQTVYLSVQKGPLWSL